jgi:hypothetical protein
MFFYPDEGVGGYLGNVVVYLNIDNTDNMRGFQYAYSL